MKLGRFQRLFRTLLSKPLSLLIVFFAGQWAITPTAIGDEHLALHVRNLIELDLVDQAVTQLTAHAKKTPRDDFEQTFGELLNDYRLPIDALIAPHPESKGLKAVLLRGRTEHRLHRDVQLLWIGNHELAEVATELMELTDPNFELGLHEEPDDEDHFAKWVDKNHEHGDDHPENDEERKRRATELTTHAIGVCLRFADADPQGAMLLADIVRRARPASLSAQLAKSLIDTIRKRSNVGQIRPLPSKTFSTVGDDLFQPSVHHYELRLSKAAIKSLHKDPRAYVKASFIEVGENAETEFTNVGVRLKGSWGSFRMIDGKEKPGFSIKFNQYDKDQRFHGLRRIILNNAVQDPTYLNEYLGYEVFRNAGIPAPRVTHATLAVNGEPYGLYVQVEAITKDFLKRWFEQSTGNLYEGPDDVENWEELDLDSNQDRENRSDLRELADAIETADEDDPWKTLQNHVAYESFLRFVAAEELIGHFDGYHAANNYRIYHAPTKQKFFFIPHGADQLFESVRVEPFEAHYGILGRALNETRHEEFVQAMQTLLDRIWDETAMKAKLGKAYLRIRPYAVSADNKGEHNVAEFERRVSSTIEFVSLREIILRRRILPAHSRTWRNPPLDEDWPEFLRNR